LRSQQHLISKFIEIPTGDLYDMMFTDLVYDHGRTWTAR